MDCSSSLRGPTYIRTGKRGNDNEVGKRAEALRIGVEAVEKHETRGGRAENRLQFGFADDRAGGEAGERLQRQGFGAERVVERDDGAVVEPSRVLRENHLRTVLQEVAHRPHLVWTEREGSTGVPSLRFSVPSVMESRS